MMEDTFLGVPGTRSTLLRIVQEVRVVIACSIGMRHIRPAHDLDLLVHPADWQQLLDMNLGQLVRGGDNPWYEIGDNIDAFVAGWPAGQFTYEQTWREAELVRLDGPEYVPVWTLAQTYAWKQAAGRVKDRRDIALIDAYARDGFNEVVSAFFNADE